MDKRTFIIKGDICYSESLDEIKTFENHYLVCEDGKIQGVFPEIPEKFSGVPTENFEGQLVIPGFTDLHLHAPQYAFRSVGMDEELLEWLQARAFPEEARYEDLEYADRAYGIFAEDMKRGATTRACMFGTLHPEATLLLMEKMEATGLVTFVGKVNMDRNSPDILRETKEESAKNTLRWLDGAKGKFKRTHPILTPRFIPSCSDGLMEELGRIRREYRLPVQSHLSENQGEIAWVRKLCPDASCYGDAYLRWGMLGGELPAIMAHCVYSGETERRLMRENGTFVAHCPQSNMNLASGIAPIRRYLEEGLKVGLGSDVAGGTTASMLHCVTDAISVSKLWWRLKDEDCRPLTVPEAFFLGTRGGGAFFGKAGSFEPGYEADILVLDESRIPWPGHFSLRERLERFLYLGDDRDVLHKYVAGERLF